MGTLIMVLQRSARLTSTVLTHAELYSYISFTQVKVLPI